MTKVQIFRTKEGHTRSFCCVGHADYKEEGEDIVCAGISAIIINTVNCLEDLLHVRMEIEIDEESGGDLIVNFPEDPGEDGELLIDCMIHGLTWIEAQYGKTYLNHHITII